MASAQCVAKKPPAGFGGGRRGCGHFRVKIVHQSWNGVVGTVMLPPELLMILTVPGS